MHYYAIIIILDENGLRSTILSFIAIISWTIYRPAKFVIVTGLLTCAQGVLVIRSRQQYGSFLKQSFV